MREIPHAPHTEPISVGDLVRIKCDNRSLDGHTGIVMLSEAADGIIFGLCVMINGGVYGFDPTEVQLLVQETEKIGYASIKV